MDYTDTTVNMSPTSVKFKNIFSFQKVTGYRLAKSPDALSYSFQTFRQFLIISFKEDA